MSDVSAARQSAQFGVADSADRKCAGAHTLDLALTENESCNTDAAEAPGRLRAPQRAALETNLSRRGFWLAVAGGPRQLTLFEQADRLGVFTVEPGTSRAYRASPPSGGRMPAAITSRGVSLSRGRGDAVRRLQRTPISERVK
ncbi:MAG: hypothetical protein QOK40_2651, partial [Miltoncostaeaceae bacterium]|nr:hypothetical protein [Miltoncostaeaceae bacterium]